MRQRILFLTNGTAMLNCSYSTPNHNYILYSFHSHWVAAIYSHGLWSPQFSSLSLASRGISPHMSWARESVAQVSNVSRIHLAENEWRPFHLHLNVFLLTSGFPPAPTSSLLFSSPRPRCSIRSTHPSCSHWKPDFIACQWGTAVLVDIPN